MAVTFAYTSVAHSASARTVVATAPSGSGGVLTAHVWWAGDNLVNARTPADWTLIDTYTEWGSSKVRRYITDVTSPDLGFDTTGDNETGVALHRISNGVLTYQTSGLEYLFIFENGTKHVADVASASNGVAIMSFSIDQNPPPPTSMSLSWVEDRYGDIGASGWFAYDMWVGHIDGITPGGGTFDAGTVTYSSGSPGLSAGVLVVATSGGGPAATSGVPLRSLQFDHLLRR